MIKTKVAFWKAGFYPAIQNNLKFIEKAMIGWKKTSPPKKPLLFWSCKQAKYGSLEVGGTSLRSGEAWPLWPHLSAGPVCHRLITVNN